MPRPQPSRRSRLAVALESGVATSYHRPHGKMHSTSTRPSHSEWSSGLPCMRWPLWPIQRLQQLRIVLVPVLPPVGEQYWRPQQCWQVRQKRKAELVASRLVRVVQRRQKFGHSRWSATASRTDRRCLTFGTSSSATLGMTDRGPLRSCTICSSRLVSRSGSARRTLASARRCSALSTRVWRSRESGSY